MVTGSGQLVAATALADLAAIKTVTDRLPDAGALTGIANDADWTEEHLHHKVRWRTLRHPVSASPDTTLRQPLRQEVGTW
jgi:hypothetical protein